MKDLEKNNRKEEDFPKDPENITKNELHEHFDLDNDGKVNIEEYSEHVNYHCNNPKVLEDKIEQAGYNRGFKYGKGGEISRNKLLKMEGNQIMDYYWETQTNHYNSMNNKELKRVYLHWFGNEGYSIEELEGVDRDEMIWDLIEDEKRYKKGYENADTKEDKEEVIDELFDFDDYAKGGSIDRAEQEKFRENEYEIQIWETEEHRDHLGPDTIFPKGTTDEEVISEARSLFEDFAAVEVEKNGQVIFHISSDRPKGKRYKDHNLRGYAKGGALEKEFKFDKNFVIYVPSTSNVGQKISKKELEARVDEVEKYVANEFGGYTETDTDGGYKSTSGEIIEEDIIKVSVFANNKDWKDNEKKVVSKVKEWAKRWGQEAIGFEYEGDLYYIDDEGKYAKGGLTPKVNKYGWHVEPFFKEGEKVLYLGKPAIITHVNKYNPSINGYTYNISRIGGGGVNYVASKSNEIRKMAKGGSLKEGDFVWFDDMEAGVRKEKIQHILPSKDGGEHHYITDSGTYTQDDIMVYKRGGGIKEKFAKGGKIGDVIKISLEPYMASFSELYGKNLTIKDIKEINFASGLQQEFLVEFNGKEYKIPARFTNKFNKGGRLNKYGYRLEDWETEYKDGIIKHWDHTPSEWYVQDQVFNSLNEAKKHIDRGSPIDEATVDAYSRGLFKKGGKLGETLYVAKIPEVFGEGMQVIGKTEQDALKYLEQAFDKRKQRVGARIEEMDFKEAMEYYGGGIWPVKINQVYWESHWQEFKKGGKVKNEKITVKSDFMDLTYLNRELNKVNKAIQSVLTNKNDNGNIIELERRKLALNKLISYKQ